MALSRVKMWTWIMSACLSWICISQAAAGPQYMMAIPAVIEAGSEATFCVDFLKPNETLTMTIVLMHDTNRTLFQKASGNPFHHCGVFQAPAVKNQVIRSLEVVVQGQTFFSREVRKVMFKPYKPMTFIQTDKPIYLPGQTVKFRVVTMDTKFTPMDEMYNVEIEDANSNRIGQWVNQTSNGKILQLSYSLNPEAREGKYRVVVHDVEMDREIDHYFKVEKYVLPKFDVKVEMRDEISIKQEEFTAEVCATYTYGQPVPGKAEVELCRPLTRHMYIEYRSPPDNDAIPDIIAPCHKESKQTDKTGCATFTFKMSTFTKPAQKVLNDELHLNAKVEEDGTGITQLQGKVIGLSYVVGKLSFIETPKVYEAQSVFQGKVKALYLDDTPIPGMLVYMFAGERWSPVNIVNVTTDSDGVASFSFDTTARADGRGDIHLKASATPVIQYAEYRTPYYEEGRHQISLIQEATVDSKTVSSLEVKKTENPLVCNGENTITIHYTIVGETAGPVDLMYLILSRATIIKQGLVGIQVDSSVTDGDISFKLEVTPEMAPLLQVLVYTVLPSETVIAHSADFTTEKCFSNKVSLEFSPSTALPGEGNTLQVSAMPGSLCGVSAIDQSVRIKEPGKQLDADKIFELMPVTKSDYMPYELEDDVQCLPVRSKRYIIHGGRDQKDAYTVFKNLGLKVSTNMLIKLPTCVRFKGREYYFEHGIYRTHTRYHAAPEAIAMNMDMTGSAGPGAGPGVPPPIQTIRSFFPETWIWDLVEVGDSGKEDVSLTVPDTITTWETEAFCLSSSGFGLAPPKELKVFQPFFLELSLPYSIVRGERFVLKATVFNYQSSCIMVNVSPSPSSDYTLTAIPGEEYSSCVCANGRKTFKWTMDASVLEVVKVTVSAEAVASQASCGNEIVDVPERGRIDVVTRSLIIKAEGTEVTKTFNWLMCPKGETLTLFEIQLQLPDNVIAGSARASVSVLGDILGRAMKNLDGLLRMPYGCGEQNMALLAPNIYILEYLKNTNQLTPAIKEKAYPFLVSGYQRQLNYKHHDGAYSTFGAGEGNTWLTAFVLRSFAQAKSFVFIDESNIEKPKSWLESKQKSNGCFEQSGKLFNNRMKGGVSDEVTLSAYITASLLEMKVLPSDPVVKNSLSCLRESIDMSMKTNTYTTALLAYVFSLARDTETRQLLLQHLDKIGSEDGGFRHWSQSAEGTSRSLSVEISSYVLLAKLASPEPSAADLGYAAGIVRWLARQQNSYGGFSSTQDTVVALQALARYSTLVFTPEGSSTVTVKSPKGEEVFQVDQSNRLLYQERALQDTGSYNLEVKGTACVSTQMSMIYNIPTPVEESSLSIKVTPEAECSSNSLRRTMTLKLQSLYTGKEATTNMVLVDVTMPSGFIPDPESLNKLKRALLVDRVEQKDDHVIMYYKELPKGIPITHVLEIIQEVEVQNLKPALVKIYDYYQPSDNQETEYLYPCNTQ